MSRVLIALTAAFALSAASVAFSQSNRASRSRKEKRDHSIPSQLVAHLRQAPKGKRHAVCNPLRKVPIKRFGLMGPGLMF
jgi:hypothetical protein